MSLIIAFLPFLAFAVVDRFAGSAAGLMVGAAAAAALMARDLLARRAPKLLELGAFVLFAGLAAWTLWGGKGRSLVETRLFVDLGMLAIISGSLLLGRPFTLQYARERAPEHVWTDPAFLRLNYRLSAAWAAAFLGLVGADLLWVYRPDLPPMLGLVLTAAALYAALQFTRKELRRRVAGSA